MSYPLETSKVNIGGSQGFRRMGCFEKGGSFCLGVHSAKVWVPDPETDSRTQRFPVFFTNREKLGAWLPLLASGASGVSRAVTGSASE